MYITCRQCGLEKPSDQSMHEYKRLEVYLTDDGILEITCARHDDMPVIGIPVDREWFATIQKTMFCECAECQRKRGEN